MTHIFVVHLRFIRCIVTVALGIVTEDISFKKFPTSRPLKPHEALFLGHAAPGYKGLSVRKSQGISFSDMRGNPENIFWFLSGMATCLNSCSVSPHNKKLHDFHVFSLHWVIYLTWKARLTRNRQTEYYYIPPMTHKTRFCCAVLGELGVKMEGAR